MTLSIDWREGTLGDVISSVRGGFSVKCEDRSALTSERGVLRTGAVLNGQFDPAQNKYVPPSEHAALRTPVSAGTIIFCRKNSDDTIGASAFVSRDFQNIFLSDLLWEIRTRQDVDVNWFTQCIKSERIRKLVRTQATGTQSTMKNISQDRLLSLPIAIPPLPEQRKIAEILRTWDEAIEALARIIRLREIQYIGLRDRLIDWTSDGHVPLRKFLKPVSRPVPKPNTPYRALSIRSHGKGSFERSVESPDSVDMETLYVTKAGDVIVNITFAWEGAIALVPPEHDGCLVSHRFPTFVPIPHKANARYLRHALRMPRFTYFLGIVSPGGAGRNRVLNKGDFLDLRAPLPNTNEQARIAAILDDAEQAIATEVEYRNALERQKRGLMQKLLTGEWRVKIDSKKEAAA